MGGIPITPGLAAVLAGEEPAALPDSLRAVEVGTVGELAVPTGRVVAHDPFVFCDWEPFERRTPTGRFPVRLVIASFTRPGITPTVAGACLQFAPGRPDRWEPALLPGEDLAALPPGHMYGVGIDSGRACFLDVAAAHELDALYAIDPDRAFRLMSEQPTMYDWHGPVLAYRLVDLDDGLNAALFRSGMGDGAYASYWGFRAGELVCLVTDFRLLTL